MVAAGPLTGAALFDALAAPPPCDLRLWRLGGAGLALQTPSALVYIDPFLAPAGGPGWVRNAPPPLADLPPPDAVLLTHEHDDHADPLALAALARHSHTQVYAPAVTAEVARGAGVAAAQLHTVLPGDTAVVAGLTVRVLPVQDHDALMPVAYHVEALVAGAPYRVYHGGDAQMSGWFAATAQRYATHCACLSVAGTHEGKQYYLTPEQSAQAAALLGARALLPLHWDLWTVNGLPRGAWDAVDGAAYGLDVVLLAPGEGWCAGG